VGEPSQGRQCEGQHLVRGLAGDARDKAHAAGVMMMQGIEQRGTAGPGTLARSCLRRAARRRGFCRVVAVGCGARGRRSGSRRVPVVRHSSL
jgi:hypothetical protein